MQRPARWVAITTRVSDNVSTWLTYLPASSLLSASNLGSTFKVVTAASALDNGVVEVSTEFPAGACIETGGQELCNFNGKDPGEHDFGYALVNSVNTTMASVGIELGEERLEETMKAFGFFTRVPWDYPADQNLASGIYNRRGNQVRPGANVEDRRLPQDPTAGEWAEQQRSSWGHGRLEGEPARQHTWEGRAG